MARWLIPVLALVILSGCLSQGATTTTSPLVSSQYDAAYLLVDAFGDLFWCDPHAWPIVREDAERNDAAAQFASIRANDAEFPAILRRLRLDSKAAYSDEEKLLIFRQHKLLTIAVEVTPVSGGYRFALRVREGQGERIEGTVAPAGTVKVEKREPSTNMCPICLVGGTFIDTPAGQVPVEDVETGMMVWTVDQQGIRVAAEVTETSSTPVPDSFQVVTVRLKDGRAVTASPGHPVAGGRALVDFQVGDALDGSVVTGVGLTAYRGGKTYDILPAGDTGVYWAGGILLRSTLAGRVLSSQEVRH